MVVKTITKKKDDKNKTVQSGYEVSMYPQRSNISLQGLNRCALTVGAHCRIGALQWSNSPAVKIYIVSKKHSVKPDQLTLANGVSEPAQFSVAISWDNIMKFNLHVNLSGFLLRQSDIQISLQHVLLGVTYQLQ